MMTTTTTTTTTTTMVVVVVSMTEGAGEGVRKKEGVARAKVAWIVFVACGKLVVVAVVAVVVKAAKIGETDTPIVTTTAAIAIDLHARHAA